MPREIIRPNYGEPVIVQLACPPEGTQREGQYGIDYQYELNDDQAITWLPAQAREAILASGAAEGDEIAITKARRGRQTVWTIERVEDETPKKPEKPTPPKSANGTPKPAAPAAAALSQRPGANLLVAAMCTAIDALTQASAYAQTKGLVLHWDAQDVRALAITMWIDARKEAAAK